MEQSFPEQVMLAINLVLSCQEAAAQGHYAICLASTSTELLAHVLDACSGLDYVLPGDAKALPVCSSIACILSLIHI